MEDVLEFGGKNFPKRSTVSYHLRFFVSLKLLEVKGGRGKPSTYEMTDKGRRHLAALA